MESTTHITTTGEQAHNPPAGNNPLLTKQDIALLIRKTERTVEVWTRKGYIPAMKVGRSVLYNWPDVQAALKRFTVNGSAGGL